MEEYEVIYAPPPTTQQSISQRITIHSLCSLDRLDHTPNTARLQVDGVQLGSLLLWGVEGYWGGGGVKCHLCSKLTRHREDTFGGEVRGGRRRGLKRMWHGHGGGETRVETDGKNKIREWCLSVSTEVEVVGLMGSSVLKGWFKRVLHSNGQFSCDTVCEHGLITRGGTPSKSAFGDDPTASRPEVSCGGR